jgi:hypothetical protein
LHIWALRVEKEKNFGRPITPAIHFSTAVNLTFWKYLWASTPDISGRF